MKRPQKLERRGIRNAAAPAAPAPTARRISSADSAVSHSSASSDSTQSPVARSSARFFCGPNPGQSAVTVTFAPSSRAISTVRSVLPESTTTISSAKATERSARAMDASSSFAIRMTESAHRHLPIR